MFDPWVHEKHLQSLSSPVQLIWICYWWECLEEAGSSWQLRLWFVVMFIFIIPLYNVILFVMHIHISILCLHGVEVELFILSLCI